MLDVVELQGDYLICQGSKSCEIGALSCSPASPTILNIWVALLPMKQMSFLTLDGLALIPLAPMAVESSSFLSSPFAVGSSVLPPQHFSSLGRLTFLGV